MKETTYEYKLPTWAICAIEYGEVDSLNDADEAAIDAFLMSLPEGNGCFSYSDDVYFSYNNDIDGLGCDVVDATYTVLNWELSHWWGREGAAETPEGVSGILKLKETYTMMTHLEWKQANTEYQLINDKGNIVASVELPDSFTLEAREEIIRAMAQATFTKWIEATEYNFEG